MDLVSGKGQSAEIYRPLTGEWSMVSMMGTARQGHTATLINVNKKERVLVVGGGVQGAPATAEYYNVRKRSWVATASLEAPHDGHTATRLENGKVLVSAGHDPEPATGQVYDPKAKTWSPAGPETPRCFHTATLLEDGTVLMAFGTQGDAASEIYMPD
jgi:hypothetical protein